jgi:subtilisin family serine protease
LYVANWFQRLLHTKSTSVRRLRSNTWQNSSSLRVEALEDRITPVRIGAGWLPRATAALAGPDLASAHLDSALLNLIQPTTSTAATESDLRPEAPKDRMLFDNTGRVEVDIAAVDVRRLWPSLEALGFQETAAVLDRHLLEGYLPVPSLVTAAGLSSDGLMGIRPIYRPLTAVGSVTTQADAVLEADRTRATAPPGVDGTGLTIGVLSDSFNHAGLNPLPDGPPPSGTGDLPVVNVLSDSTSASNTDEGRGMLELIHDVAPGASLAFATGNGGDAMFAQHIRDLADPAKGNAKIIVDDLTYFDEPFYQDGLVAQAVDDVVTNRGVAYFSSAGNLQDQAYESNSVNFVSATIPTISPSPALYYDFGGGNVRQSATINGGFIAGFQWDQPFFTVSGVTSNLDIYYMVHNSNSIITSATTNNIATQTPLEVPPGLSGSGTFDIVIRLRAGPAPGRIKYVNFGSNSFGPATFVPATHSPTITPHAGSANAMAVAAAPYYRPRLAESFTSLGPTTILFSTSGTPLGSPQVRPKPDVTAIDGTNTSFFPPGGGNDLEGDGYPNFFGTSAAAPHAAAVAALVRQANPAFTPAQVYARLKSTADPNIGGSPDLGGATGDPNLVGAGLIDAYRAVIGTPAPAGLNTTDGFESGVLSQKWETYTAGSGRIRVINGNGPASGTYQLAMDSSLNGFVVNGLSEAIVHVNATGAGPFWLSFNEKEFNDPDDTLPSSFTGHGNYDGVALSVDGTNWFRIVSLTGTSSTNSYQLQSFNLSAIAASFGLSLSADTRIKFQSYDVNAFFVPTQGVAFDDVSVYASLRAGGFEVPVVGTGFFGAFQFGPSGTAWSYAGGAGVTGNGSGFTGGNPPAPEGTQVAFLQSINSSVSQTFTAAAGTYRVSFRAAQRAFQPGGGAQQVRVLVDGADLGTFTPAGTAYQAFATAALTLADGVHTLSLVGLTAGDNTALLDLVAVAPA